MIDKIPIFIIFKNQKEWTKTCLSYLKKNTPRDKYFLVLINNGSAPIFVKEIKEFLDGEDVFVNFDSPVTVGYAYNFSVNKYAKNSKYFITLHNDVLVTSGWLDELLDCSTLLNDRDEIFTAISSRTNYAYIGSPVAFDEDARDVFLKHKNNTKAVHSEEGIEEILDKTYENFGGLEKYKSIINRDYQNKFKISDELNSFCTLFNTSIFFGLGMFCDEFIQSGAECKLLDYLAKKKSCFSILSLGCYVHHNGNTTNDAFGHHFGDEFKEDDNLLKEKITKIEDEEKIKIRFNIKYLKEKMSMLVLRDSGIGDIIMTMFSLQGLKRRFDNIEITFGTDSKYFSFVKRFSCIDRVIPISFDKEEILDKNKIERITADYYQKFDIVVNLIRYFEMFNKFSNDHRINQAYIYIRDTIDKLGASCNFDPIFPEFSFSKSDRSISLGKVGICPLGSCDLRSIPRSVFERIVRIESKNKQILILGEENIPLKIENINRENVVDLSGKTSLDELISAIGSCDYVYTSDSGNFHIAGLLGVPCRAFFGSIDPQKRTFSQFTGKNIETIYYKKGMECVPCNDVGCKGIYCMNYSDEEIEKIVLGMPL